MILVTLGTQDKKFTRLLSELDALIENKVIQDKVIVQAGFSSDYSSNNMETTLQVLTFPINDRPLMI